MVTVHSLNGLVQDEIRIRAFVGDIVVRQGMDRQTKFSLSWTVACAESNESKAVTLSNPLHRVLASF
jgi:hypothetical protein